MLTSAVDVVALGVALLAAAAFRVGCADGDIGELLGGGDCPTGD